MLFQLNSFIQYKKLHNEVGYKPMYDFYCQKLLLVFTSRQDKKNIYLPFQRYVPINSQNSEADKKHHYQIYGQYSINMFTILLFSTILTLIFIFNTSKYQNQISSALWISQPSNRQKTKHTTILTYTTYHKHLEIYEQNITLFIQLTHLIFINQRSQKSRKKRKNRKPSRPLNRLTLKNSQGKKGETIKTNRTNQKSTNINRHSNCKQYSSKLPSIFKDKNVNSFNFSKKAHRQNDSLQFLITSKIKSNEKLDTQSTSNFSNRQNDSLQFLITSKIKSNEKLDTQPTSNFSNKSINPS
eukprot:TRINITY_DN6822_c0_g1_i18.p2 TRINITY_DN6822_c0_g1~~TRINITY_DN6822_c0_g1_i18.p2  ORF type:complete len:298 (+),score=-17.28 TRINITY_DN6822_c0_g1_i18:704-1597(+)